LPAHFGKYQLLSHIAEGGMADVYLGRLPGPGGFEKRLVVKVIRPELAARREFCELFVAEAKVTVSLTHANIVPVYELGMVEGQYYLAMELVDGPTLHQLLFDRRPGRGGPLPPPLAAYVAEQVLRGLDYAHRCGVVHRDLSSANVMCSRQGEVKIVDFGIAGHLGSGVELRGGSVGYMAPEQVQGGVADARSDLYAVGVLLGEMLTGRRFSEDLPAADLPAPLREVVKTAAAPAPEARYTDAAAMLVAISRYLRQVDPPTQSDLSALVRRRAPDERRLGLAALPRIVTGFVGSDLPSTRPIPRARPQKRPSGLLQMVSGPLEILDDLAGVRSDVTPAPASPLPRRAEALRRPLTTPPLGLPPITGLGSGLGPTAAGPGTPVMGLPALAALPALPDEPPPRSPTPAGPVAPPAPRSSISAPDASSAVTAPLSTVEEAHAARGAPAGAAGTVTFASRPAGVHATWRTYAGGAGLLLALFFFGAGVRMLQRPPLLPPPAPARPLQGRGPGQDPPPPPPGDPRALNGSGALDIELPEGATLELDGAKVPVGVPHAVRAGRHRLAAQAPGRREVVLDVEVPAGATVRQRLVLPWAMGHLRLESVPPGAAVTLQGEAAGVTPLDLDVPIDRKTSLRLQARGHAALARDILPSEWVSAAPEARLAGETEGRQPEMRLLLRLDPLARGSLTVGAMPWAQVFIDGERRGDTPLRRLSLSAGSHALRLYCPPPSCAEAREFRQSITIEPSREARRIVDFRLNPPVAQD
jgi:serine/threonine protein kinase